MESYFLQTEGIGGRGVAQFFERLQFKSSHRQNNYIERLLSTVVIKTKIKKKRLGMALFEKIEAIRLPGPLIRPFKNSLFGLNSDLT